MRKTLSVLLAAAAMFLAVPRAQAAISPVGISILPPVQFPPSEFSVTGARVSAIWGQHRDVYGIDVGGIGNFTELTFTGLAVAGVFNVTHGTTTILGLQAAGAANVNTQKTHVIGLQVAAVNSNTAESAVVGLQVGAIANLSDHTNIYGIQAGLYNTANEVYGFQVGLVNRATNLHGLQVGVANFNEKGLFKICPIINIGF